ncbi:MAG: pyridoxamine 5'-phosphate oxidase family protein [Chitinophagaceae bacterium]|nr:pyridoxamine 5'-phosphate oxidase family protein [Chitinophagaceae bacterium]
MSLLTAEIKDFITIQKLGYYATVSPDGLPNLSPKGTTLVWDDNHLVFADIHSPGTVGNLRSNPAIEINMVDVFTRKGFRFRGTATVFSSGEIFDAVLMRYRAAGAGYKINHIVMVELSEVLPLWSPVYDTGIAEEEVIQRWTNYWKEQHSSAAHAGTK